MRKYLKMIGIIGKTSRQETQAPANWHQLPIAQSWGNQFNYTEVKFFISKVWCYYQLSRSYCKDQMINVKLLCNLQTIIIAANCYLYYYFYNTFYVPGSILKVLHENSFNPYTNVIR